jgi:hypothetical protein
MKKMGKKKKEKRRKKGKKEENRGIRRNKTISVGRVKKYGII